MGKHFSEKAGCESGSAGEITIACDGDLGRFGIDIADIYPTLVGKEDPELMHTKYSVVGEAKLASGQP